MPVYRNSKLIHIHIPKTGGTAIERFFHKIGDMEWNGNSLVGHKKTRDRWIELQHLTMVEVLERTADEFETFHSFAVVRNPYSRLVSTYRWRNRVVNQSANQHILAFDSFKEFIKSIPKDMDQNWYSYIRDADMKFGNFLIHIRPQFHYTESDSGMPLVSEILHFENLRDEFDKLCRRLGHINNIVGTSSDVEFMEYYDSETIEIVNTLYQKDFGLGNYALS